MIHKRYDCTNTAFTILPIVPHPVTSTSAIKMTRIYRAGGSPVVKNQIEEGIDTGLENTWGGIAVTPNVLYSAS